MTTISIDEFRAILRQHLATFIERAFYELNPQAVFQYGAYIGLIAAKLEQCLRGEITRLIINAPPRTLKSHAASVAYVAWLLGHDPTKQIICASYNQELADKHARDCRTVMASAFYRGLFPQTVLSPTKKSVNEFTTTKQGFRMATSVGGTLTGRGADVIILDDILKPEEALSETRRRAVNEWFFNTLMTRLNSKANGVIILVMQRLHQEDLVGEVLDKGPWEVLSLPAIAIKDECHLYQDIFGPHTFERKQGEALHPERDSVEKLLDIARLIGEYNFQSQFQQSPTSREGGIVKRAWLKFYEGIPTNFCRTVQSWDTACKTGDSNDYSVCTTWRLIQDRYYLIDVYRARLSYPDLKRKALELFKKFRPQVVYIEDQASGTALIQELAGEGLYCAEPYRPEPGSDKLARFHAHSIKFEAGKVYLPKVAPWLEDYIAEITGFPGTKHDDQVDSTSQALEMLAPLARFMTPPSGPVRLFSPPVYESY